MVAFREPRPEDNAPLVRLLELDDGEADFGRVE